MKHAAWEPLSTMLNEHGLERVIDTLGRIVTFDALRNYASPNDIPQLDLDVINVCAKHRITTADDLVDEHWLDGIMADDDPMETPDNRVLLEQLLDGLQNDVFTDAPERALSVANIRLIAEALRKLYPKAATA